MTNQKTQITVFGANGRIGRLVVHELQARGFFVVAAVRARHHFTESSTLHVVTADVYDSNSVERAIEGSTIVVSTLGSWGTKRKDVLTVGTTSIIAAMQAQSIHRFVSLTGAESRSSGDTYTVIHRIMHLLLAIVAPKILADGEAHIKLLEQSQLDWTVIRSPIMTDRSQVGRGVLSLVRPLPWQLISRRFVTAGIARCVADNAWNKQAPYIS